MIQGVKMEGPSASSTQHIYDHVSLVSSGLSGGLADGSSLVTVIS